MSGLKPKQFELLVKLVHSRNKQSRKIFDKHDNCFQKSIREIEIITKHSKSSVGRLFHIMREKDLVRDVIDISGTKRLMLNPAFRYYRNHQYFGKFYQLAMYHLGGDAKANQWSKKCREHGVLYDYKLFGEVIDFGTGEVNYGPIIRRLTTGEWKRWDDEIRKHSCFDRVKKRAKSAIIF